MPNPIAARVARRSLQKKGFTLKERDHHFYVHRDSSGEKTGAYVYFSHGLSGSDQLSPALLKRMCLELGLETIQQVADLLVCPMDAEAYAAARRVVRSRHA